jgi:hypothetical protein
MNWLIKVLVCPELTKGADDQMMLHFFTFDKQELEGCIAKSTYINLF